MGGTPTLADPAGGLVTVTQQGFNTVAHYSVSASTTGTTYTLQASTDLIRWSDVQQAATLESPELAEMRTYAVSGPNAGTRCFFRRKIEMR